MPSLGSLRPPLSSGRSPLIILTLAAGLGISLTACRTETPEAKVRALVHRTVEAANDKDTSEVMEAFSERFCGKGGPQLTGERGCAKPEQVRRVVLAHLLQPGWVRVFVRQLDVQVADDGTTAEATVLALLARGQPVEELADLVPSNASAYRFEMKLELEDGEWKFVAGTTERADARRLIEGG